ncbi:hypothetical protein D3C73_764560 [compost metagenome]
MVDAQIRRRNLRQIARIVIAFAQNLSARHFYRDNTICIIVGIPLLLSGSINNLLQPIFRVIRLLYELLSLLRALQPALRIIDEHNRRDPRIGIFNSNNTIFTVEIRPGDIAFRARLRKLLLCRIIYKRRSRSLRASSCLRHRVGHVEGFQTKRIIPVLK